MRYDLIWLLFWGLMVTTMFRYGGAFALVLSSTF